MRIGRGHWALLGTAATVAGFMLSPAIGARSDLQRLRDEMPVSLGALGSISSFTPSIKDPRLAAAYAKIAVSARERGFRFTPTSGSMSGQRSVTVMVRATDRADESKTVASVDIKPMAFSLNTDARSWRKFALPESVGRKALDPVASEGLDARGFNLQQGGKDRFSTKAVIETRREPGLGVRSAGADKDYTLDLASSYSLTRNLNVTAGVRYNAGAPGRLAPITDDRQDAQAVYLGTVFKF